MIYRFQLLGVLIVLFLCGGFAMSQNDTSPDAAAILNHYRDSLLWRESVSMKIDINDVPTGFDDKGPYGMTLQFRHDRGRAELHGCIFPQNKDPYFTNTIDYVFMNNRFIDFSKPAQKSVWPAFISGKDVNERLENFLDNSDNGGPLWGKISGNDHKTIADLLLESTDMTIRQDSIEDIDCFVLEGTCRYGIVKAWIAPQFGYSALKWSLEKRKGIDKYGDGLCSMDLWTAVFDSVKFEEISNQFIPVYAVFTSTMTPGTVKNKFINRQEYTISDIQLNPDFASMKAFDVNFPDGKRIYLEEAQGIKHKWQKGKAVPDIDGPTFDEIDKTIDDFKQQQ
jgi:hypothetical protein